MSKSAHLSDSNGINRLKDMLVSLSVDIEDKNKLCEVLKRKIENERIALAESESRVSNEKSIELREEVEKYRRSSEQETSNIASCMAEKKRLLEQCESSLEVLTSRDNKLKNDIKKIHRDGDELMEQDKRTYKSSYEERLSNKIQQRLQEHKDNTARALEPEIQRLKIAHEKEVHELKYMLQTRQQALREDASKRLSSRISNAENSILSDRDTKIRAIDDEHISQMKEVEHSHLSIMEGLRDELDRQYARAKVTLLRRAEQDRQEGQSELLRQQEFSQKRIDDIRKKLHRELQDLEKDFDHKKRIAKKAYEEKKRRIDISLQQTNANSPLELPTMTDDDDSACFQSAEESFDGKAKSKQSLTTSKKESEEQIASILRSRDQQIQSVIRSLQTETVRLEKQWKASAEEALREIDVGMRRDEAVLRERQTKINDEIAILIFDNQQVESDIPALQRRIGELDSELSKLNIEQSTLDNEVNVTAQRLSSVTEMAKRRRVEEEEVFKMDLQQLRDQFDSATETLRKEKEMLDQKLRLMEEEYDDELERLDKEVKRDVNRLDEDIAAMRENIQRERTAVDRLQKLVLKYSASK